VNKQGRLSSRDEIHFAQYMNINEMDMNKMNINEIITDDLNASETSSNALNSKQLHKLHSELRAIQTALDFPTFLTQHQVLELERLKKVALLRIKEIEVGLSTEEERELEHNITTGWQVG